MTELERSWHAMETEEVVSSLESSFNGLSEEEAKSRLQKFGPNELVAKKGISAFRILLGQFKNILVIILISATLFSVFIREYIESSVILVIVVAAALLGFLQEYRAEKALEGLKKMLSPTTKVLREGKEKEIPLRELVPGDLILLEAGDKISGDGRLLEVVSLQIDEASLTGESVPVDKELKVLSERTFVGDRKNMVFSGTIVTYGKGMAIVTATGMNTEFGKIAQKLTTIEREETPLEKRTKEIGKWLGVLCLIICIGVAIFGIAREYFIKGFLSQGFILDILMFSIALAVAAIPEALPAVVTSTLAIGMHEMAKRNALVRKMPAVETLGATSVICADKTGTLTKGEMTIRCLYIDDQIIQVSGIGYLPEGKLYLENGNLVEIKENSTLELLMKACILCNDAKLEEKEGKWFIRGDPTEGALIVLAEKAGFHQEKIKNQYPRIDEKPFSSERKRMTTMHLSPERKKIVFMKGAPEVLLERCSFISQQGQIRKLLSEEKKKILHQNEEMAQKALRVLALAYKELSQIAEVPDEDLEENLVFLGLVGMIDPPRQEAIEAVKVAKEIGMKPIMITGDHKLTALAIAKEMGIFEEGDIVLTGEELERLKEEDLDEIVDKVTVYARISPIQKLKIVKAWKKKGKVVAMTGDGVNDAPAVKQADIGISMGLTGTEVTKEASDMILGDDNFATIVKAIEQGRWIFDNIKKYLTYLLESNLVEIIVLSIGVFLGLPLALLPAQILFINLVTDGLPALALGVSPADPDIMKRPPRDPKESVFTREVKIFLIAIPIISSSFLLWVFISSLPEGIEIARTRLFLMFIFFELVIALNCRSLTHSVFRVRPHKFLVLAIFSQVLLSIFLISLPSARDALKIVFPSFQDFGLVLVACLIVFFSLELVKYLLRKNILR